jgi:hypothetical protein
MIVAKQQPADPQGGNAGSELAWRKGQERQGAREARRFQHLQIYRWYLTMALSILHRITVSALVLGSCSSPGG